MGRGLVTFRMAERYVSVKGVAERTVTADVGLWPLRWVATGDALEVAQRKVEVDRRAVLAFLARHGLDSTHTELQRLEVVDTQANEYQQARAASRFIVRMTLMVRTSEPEKIRVASQDIGELVAACVSGALTLEDSLAMVAERARLMEAAPEGVMVSVALKAGGAEVVFDALKGEIYELQGSVDLEDWGKLGTVTNLTGRSKYLDTGATNRSARFYRVLWP